MRRLRSLVKSFTLSAAVLLMAGCVSLAAVEPVAAPPSQFRVDATTDVEFLPPRAVGGRCAQRGGKVFGLPAFSAMACANTQLMTMPDPCAVKPRTRYSDMLCETLNLGESTDETTQAETHSKRLLLIEFVHPDDLVWRCSERSGLYSDMEDGKIVACRNSVMMTVINPCLSEARGWYDNLLCHELGHVNGWPANHSRAKNRSVSPRTGRTSKQSVMMPAHRQKEMAEAAQMARERDPIQFVRYGSNSLSP